MSASFARAGFLCRRAKRPTPISLLARKLLWAIPVRGLALRAHSRALSVSGNPLVPTPTVTAENRKLDSPQQTRRRPRDGFFPRHDSLQFGNFFTEVYTTVNDIGQAVMTDRERWSGGTPRRQEGRGESAASRPPTPFQGVPHPWGATLSVAPGRGLFIVVIQDPRVCRERQTRLLRVAGLISVAPRGGREKTKRGRLGIPGLRSAPLWARRISARWASR
jgi:hypothetical protein